MNSKKHILCVVSYIEKKLLENNIFLDTRKIPTVLEVILAFYMISLKNHAEKGAISIRLTKTHKNYLNIVYCNLLTEDKNKSNLQNWYQNLLPSLTIFKIINKILEDSDISCSTMKDDNTKFFTLNELLENLNRLDLIKLILNAKLALMRLGGVSYFNSDSTRVQIPLDYLISKN